MASSCIRATLMGWRSMSLAQMAASLAHCCDSVYVHCEQTNERPSACVSPFAFHQCWMVQQYLRFFLPKLTAVHVDQLLLVNAQPFLLSLSLSFSFFFTFSFALFLTSFRMTVFFYFISFPPGKLRETWIFECYQIWCLVRVSHYQGYKLSLIHIWRCRRRG